MTSTEQDKYLLEILDALEESNKCGSMEIPKEALENDENFLQWIMGLA